MGLKAGGLAYVSYNAMPGWNGVGPFQRLFLEHSRLTSGASDRAIEEAVEFAERLAKLGAPGIGDPEVLPRLRKELERGNVAYLAHEYLNGHWRPLYHADVAREMAAAKLTFVANGTILDNFPELSLSDEKRDLLAGVADPIARETFRDYLSIRAFRRDLYIRGPRRLDEKRRDAQLLQTRLALIVGPSNVKREIDVPIGKAELEPGLYEPVLQALAAGPRSIDQLVRLESIRSRESPKPVEIAGMLVGSGQAVPLAGADDDAARAASLAHNRVLIDEVDFAPGFSAKALASPVAGTGLHLQIFELFACRALLDGASATAEALVDHTWARLRSTGDRLRRQGVQIESEEETRAVLAPEMEAVVREAVPIWRHLGLV